MNVNENLLYADYLIRKSSFKKNGFDYIYPFTTENINGYFPLHKLINKNVLTVGSSSDQILNAFLMDAKTIDCFDINPFTKYYFDLKKAAIKTLTLQEYKEFFSYFEYSKIFSGNKNAFNLNSFYKIVDYLEEDSLIFWASLFKKYKGLTIRKGLFSFDENDISIVIKLNNYLNEENYHKLKSNIDKLHPTFYYCDIKNICKYLNKKYDFIFLSNIANYIYYSHNNSLEEYRKNIIEFNQFMFDESLVFFAYLYEVDKDTKIKGYWDKICQLSLVKNTFKDDHVYIESFIGVKGVIYDDNRYKDSVLIYKK